MDSLKALAILAFCASSNAAALPQLLPAGAAAATAVCKLEAFHLPIGQNTHYDPTQLLGLLLHRELRAFPSQNLLFRHCLEPLCLVALVFLHPLVRISFGCGSHHSE